MLTGSRSEALAERLENCYSGAVYDALRAAGRPQCAIPPGIGPLEATMKAAGPVFTVEGRIQDADAHESLLAWTRFLSRAPAGSVVVCQPHDDTLAHMGELSAETLHHRGVKGFVVDGGCRDTGFVARLGFPVFCRYTTPRDIVGRWLPERLGDALTIGEVTVRPGDFCLADRDGAVIVPADIAEDIVAATEQVLATENLVRRAILEGVDPETAYLRHGKF